MEVINEVWSAAKHIDIGLEPYFWRVREWSGLNDHLFFVTTFSLCHTVTFIVLNALLFLVHYENWFPQYKIQGAKYPEGQLLKDALIHVSRNHFFTTPIQLYFFYYIIRWRIGDNLFGPPPSVIEGAAQILGFMLIEDFMFYWLHRGLHHKSIYKYVHKKHHEFKTTVGIASEYAHPIEEFLANTLPFMTGPLLLQSHLCVMNTWIIVRISETVDAHGGYEWPFSPFH
eukprot:Ihof_evm12s76 gene=Ihof_evmTU12s76